VKKDLIEADLTGDDLIETDLTAKVEWSTEYQLHHKDERCSFDRREGSDRRKNAGRSITVPNMRKNDRRIDCERRKVRLIITGRAMDV